MHDQLPGVSWHKISAVLQHKTAQGLLELEAAMTADQHSHIGIVDLYRPAAMFECKS